MMDSTEEDRFTKSLQEHDKVYKENLSILRSKWHISNRNIVMTPPPILYLYDLEDQRSIAYRK